MTRMADMTRFSLLRLGLNAILVYLAFQLFLIIKRAIYTSLWHIPGPWYAPWTNIVLKLHVMTGNRSQYIHTLHEAYGPYVRISPDEISVSDLSSIKVIHRVGTDFRKSPWYQKFNESPHPGVFSMTDSKQHAARRRLFAQNFSKTSLTQFEAQVGSKVATAVSKIKRDMQAGNADILKWFTFMATDVIGQLSFGTSFNMLEQETKTPYIRDLETTMMIGGISAELKPLVLIAKRIPIPSLQRALSLNKRLDEYGLAAIENYKNHLNSSCDRKSGSLFSKFLDPTKNSELTLPEISAEASNLIVAGSDTTAVSLTYLIWSVLHRQHQPVKAKLLAEIATLPLDASVTDIGQLKYVDVVITESLRLYGAAPGSLPRVSPSGGAKLGPYIVPGGTTVSVQAYTVHRDPTIFPDPEKFLPERWENPSNSMKEAFFPFGLGSRFCLGVHLAMNELLLGTFLFFKTCPAAILAESTTDESMGFENFFLIAPKSHRCEVTS